MVYVDPTIPLPAEPSHTLPRPLFSVPPRWPASLNSLGTWYFLPAPTDLLISHFDSYAVHAQYENQIFVINRRKKEKKKRLHNLQQ